MKLFSPSLGFYHEENTWKNNSVLNLLLTSYVRYRIRIMKLSDYRCCHMRHKVVDFFTNRWGRIGWFSLWIEENIFKRKVFAGKKYIDENVDVIHWQWLLSISFFSMFCQRNETKSDMVTKITILHFYYIYFY